MSQNIPPTGKVLLRDYTRFAFYAPDKRARLPEGFRMELSPLPVEKLLRRVLPRESTTAE